MKCQRQITINVSVKKAHHFMREVQNLPIWTRFFKRCIGYNGSIGEMETPLGKSMTSIQEKDFGHSVTLLICSKFGQRQEKAMVIIKGNEQQVDVAFHLKMPPQVNKEQQKKMVANLEEELGLLKQHLELNHA